MVRNDIRYKIQQTAIREVCEELDLVAFYPTYHGDQRDDNTVLIYKKEPYSTPCNDLKNYICNFINTDIYGRFSLDWMNNGKIDCRNGEKENIKTFLD